MESFKYFDPYEVFYFTIQFDNFFQFSDKPVMLEDEELFGYFKNFLKHLPEFINNNIN